jgi:hypothetical protein
MLEENLSQMKAKVEAMLAAGRVPLLFLDLDETLNRAFGALIEEPVVTALRHLHEAGGLFGPNTGANISWAGERIFSETDRFFPFPFLLLATGEHIAAWVQAVHSYVRLPIQAHNKGEAMRQLAQYLDLSLDQFLFIADFPGAGDRQEGIDDPVLREPLGVIVNVGWQRRPEEIKTAFPESLLLHPQRQGDRFVGIGYEATIQYVDCLSEVLRQQRYTEKVKALHAEVMRAVESKLNLPVLANQEPQLWTFEQPFQAPESSRPVLIRVKGPGMVHAGVSREGKWLRIYDVPLQEISPCVWEASVWDPEVNAFTFIWYDPNKSGKVHWEGKNYRLPARLAPSISLGSFASV